jgi:hypothetical protein
MASTHANILNLYMNHQIPNFIGVNLSVRESEKNKYGEVFTSYSYICILLDQLPSSVWSNPSLRWLEPASGIGHFCLVIYMRLMNGLAEIIPDVSTRHEHILRNMLFMVEINEDNVARTRDLFGPSLVNIHCADFLDTTSHSICTTRIDIIIGNPPFQMPRDGSRSSSKGGQILWDKFILKSLEILSRDGDGDERFLCFITPPLWRKPNSPHGLWEKMTRDQCSLCYLHMVDKKTGIRDLQVQQRMDLFIVKVAAGAGGGAAAAAGECQVVTSVADGSSLHTITPRDWPFLPNADFSFIKSIIELTPVPRRVIYDRSSYGSDLPHMSPEYNPAGGFIYPVVHTMTRRGLGVWYSNTKARGHFGVPKVILNFNEKLYPYLDYAGEYGMGQFSFGLPVTSVAQGEAIVRALVLPKFRCVVKATKWGAYQTDRRMFEYFREEWWG